MRGASGVVTLHVDHKDESVEYPVAADPEYEVVYQRWEVRWWPEQRPETYVVKWHRYLAPVESSAALAEVTPRGGVRRW